MTHGHWGARLPAMALEEATPLPRKTLAVLCCIGLIDCINATILNPYVDDMVSMLLKTDRGSPDVSMWVSVLVGSYSLCEALKKKSSFYIL